MRRRFSVIFAKVQWHPWHLDGDGLCWVSKQLRLFILLIVMLIGYDSSSVASRYVQMLCCRFKTLMCMWCWDAVTVTISSDEDEDPSSETYQQPSATSKPVNPSASAAPPSAVSASNCDDEDFFPSSASKPTSAFSVCRRNKVADVSLGVFL